jgi:hypothetical protein
MKQAVTKISQLLGVSGYQLRRIVRYYYGGKLDVSRIAKKRAVDSNNHITSGKYAKKMILLWKQQDNMFKEMIYVINAMIIVLDFSSL